VLRFDFTGLGESEGEFKESHFSANVNDLLDVAQHMAEHYASPSILIGHSLGGAAVIHAGADLTSVEAIVTIGAPSDPEHVTHLFAEQTGDLVGTEEKEVNIGGRPFVVNGEFVQHLEQKDAVDVLKSIRKTALLFCHSPQDTIVSVDHAARLYKAARHPKSFLSLDGADHLLSKKQDSLYVGQMIAAWAGRYVEIGDAEELKSDVPVVVSLSEPGFTTKIKSRQHSLIGDEPKSLGGDDLGPSPYDFVSIGLATCTAMTIRMYTDRKGWLLEDIEVHVDHQKVHAKDLEHPEAGRGKVDHFFRKIKIIGAMDEAQRKRIMQIADKCPVHKTLEGEVHVVTEELS
jgi:putative redox protein